MGAGRAAGSAAGSGTSGLVVMEFIVALSCTMAVRPNSMIRRLSVFLFFMTGIALAGPPIHIVRKNPPAVAGGAARTPVNDAGTPECNPSPCDPNTMLDIEYFGGKVIPNVKVYAVFWTSGVDSTTQNQIGPFYQALTNSNWMDWLNEYSTAGINGGSNQLIGRGTYAGAYTITPSTVAHICVVDSQGAFPPMGTICIWDIDIPTAIDAQINAGHLPLPDQHTIYMVHFPATYEIQSADRGANISDSCVQYCAYHSTYTRNGFGSVYYAVLPDHTSTPCALGCGIGTAFQNLCSSASHEIGEGITDAEVGIGTAIASPLAWYDNGSNSQGEIGDMCNQVSETITSLGGTQYTVQDLFSKKIWDLNR